MNCKKGDMAVVVRSYADNHGKTVTCLEYLTGGEEFTYQGVKYKLKEGHWWRVDRVLNLMYDGKVFKNCAPYCQDSFLMPIGNSDTPVAVEDTEEEPA